MNGPFLSFFERKGPFIASVWAGKYPKAALGALNLDPPVVCVVVLLVWW